MYNSQEKCKYQRGGTQIQIGRASRHLLLQFMSRPLPQREMAEPLSQTSNTYLVFLKLARHSDCSQLALTQIKTPKSTAEPQKVKTHL